MPTFCASTKQVRLGAPVSALSGCGICSHWITCFDTQSHKRTLIIVKKFLVTTSNTQNVNTLSPCVTTHNKDNDVLSFVEFVASLLLCRSSS